jgi:hypothetical protein
MDRWSNFFSASGGAAAALTGLLFIAVSLRPREIRQSPLMVGRARSAFYGFAAITFVALLALAGTSSSLIGVAQLAVAAGFLAISARFTRSAHRARHLNYRRAIVYHAGLIAVGGAGALRAVGGGARDYSVVLAVGVMLLLGIALSNSWQLVISHESDESGGGPA